MRGGRGRARGRGIRGFGRGRGRGLSTRGRGRGRGTSTRGTRGGRDRRDRDDRRKGPSVYVDTSHPLYETGLKLYKLIRRSNPLEFESILSKFSEDSSSSDSKNDSKSDNNSDTSSSDDSEEEKKSPEQRARELNYLMNEWKGKQFGDTLLIISSYYNSPDIVKICLKYGAKINARDVQGRTSLFWACRNDSLQTVNILLENGCDPNLYNTEDNTTVLWFAGFNGNISIMKKLIEYGFNVNKLINQSNQKTGYNVIHQVCEKGFLECLKYLYKSCGKNVIDIYIKTTNHEMNALQLACNNSQVPVVEYLVNELNFLDKPGVVNDATLNGKTALWYAALDGNLEIIELLCSKSGTNIDVNKVNDAGHSPLYMSSMRNHFECTKWLITTLSGRIDCNIKSKKEGMTPLMVSVKCGNLRTVEILSNDINVKLNDIKDKVGRNVFDYCAKFGQTDCLKILIKSLLKRLNINTWEQLEESKILTIKMIENWIKLAKKQDKGANKGPSGNKPNDNVGHGGKADDSKNDSKDQKETKIVKKIRKTKNDGVIHFLEDLINGCFKFNNFELLLARLDYSNTVTKGEVSKKLRECEKLNEITRNLFKYCSNKQILIEFSEIVVKMIENKEIVDDTLMMIASKCVPNQLETALVNSVKGTISGDVTIKEKRGDELVEDMVEEYDDEKQGGGINIADIDADDIDEINKKKREINKEHRQSRRNVRDIAWYKECILNSNILSDIYLFNQIKVESIQQELENQQLYLSKQISFIKEINETSWNNLLNYKEFNISLDGVIQQKRVISKFDATSKNMVAMNGIPVDYEQKSLFVDYLTGFNMSAEYDNNSYLISLLIAAHKMNPLFQRHCRKLLSEDVLGVPCDFKRAPVKTKQRCQLKAVMDYSDREWPFTNHILDILRCSVVFDSPSELVIGLNKFRTIMKQGLRQQKGCLVDIVRIKNGFQHYLQVNESNKDDLSLYQYSDIKINVIIEIGNYKMIGEIIFMLDFMTLAKEIGHIFYGFERNEELYSDVNELLNEIDESMNDASDENTKNNESYLKTIIGTRNYSLLLSYILFGRFENEMKKRINKINFRDMVKFCKDNQWKDGFKLLKDAMKQYGGKRKWWMPQTGNSYLMVDID